MDIMIKPGKLSGSITAPASKSLLHRYILCAALADGESRIMNSVLSEDIYATLRCISSLGAKWRIEDDALLINGMGCKYSGERPPMFDCGESGTTLRFFIPVACVLCGGGVFTGKGRLLERPLRPYFDIFDKSGVKYTLTGSELKLEGRLNAGEYHIPGNISSQFFSGLMFSMALCSGESVISADGVLESSAYVDMTCSALKHAGINAARSDNVFRITGGSFKPIRYSVEADWSQAAFWIAANALGSSIDINGLSERSAQGDRRISEIAELLMAEGTKEIDMSQCPDLLPPAAAIAAFSRGSCRFTGCERLRYKESDRVSAVRDVLCALGADVVEHSHGLTVIGKKELSGGVTVDSRNDHRIAMMASIAALGCHKPVVVSGCECVNKSYPNFYEHFSALGGEAHAV